MSSQKWFDATHETQKWGPRSLDFNFGGVNSNQEKGVAPSTNQGVIPHLAQVAVPEEEEADVLDALLQAPRILTQDLRS